MKAVGGRCRRDGIRSLLLCDVASDVDGLLVCLVGMPIQRMASAEVVGSVCYNACQHGEEQQSRLRVFGSERDIS